MSRCKSCQAEILWCKTESGKTIPVDPQQVIDGNIRLYWDADKQTYTQAVVGANGSGPYVSHFATCPNAKQHRTKRVVP